MIKSVYMPDIGNYNNIIITDILITEGDIIQKNSNIITVEAGKTTIDIPCPYNGIIKKINISIGSVIKKNSTILYIDTKEKSIKQKITKKIDTATTLNIQKNITPYASPNIRRLARSSNIELKKIEATGQNNRITRQDIENNIIDPHLIEKINLSQKKIISNNILSNSWKHIPHVTQFSNLEINKILILYKKEKENLKKQNIKLTLLPFIIKALTKSLENYPYLNSSLSEKNQIIIKHYYNIGIVVSTEEGLIIPIIKDTNKKNIFEINSDLISKIKHINDKTLLPKDTENGTFSISNLGQSTNNFFTPIIKHPEAAILGISKYETNIIDLNKTTLPLSLSYDHRIIDGLYATNFINNLQNNLININSIYN